MKISQSQKLVNAIIKAVDQSDLTRYEIAKRSGVDESVLSKIVRGERGISPGNLDKLCACLGLEIIVQPREQKRKGKVKK